MPIPPSQIRALFSKPVDRPDVGGRDPGRGVG